MLKSATAPVAEFAAEHPELAHGLAVGAGVLLAGALIIGGTRLVARNLNLID